MPKRLNVILLNTRAVFMVSPLECGIELLLIFGTRHGLSVAVQCGDNVPDLSGIKS